MIIFPNRIFSHVVSVDEQSHPNFIFLTVLKYRHSYSFSHTQRGSYLHALPNFMGFTHSLLRPPPAQKNPSVHDLLCGNVSNLISQKETPNIYDQNMNVLWRMVVIQLIHIVLLLVIQVKIVSLYLSLIHI